MLGRPAPQVLMLIGGFAPNAYVAIAGFDDTALASAINPPLTTVRVPQREMGVVGAQMILSRLAGKPMGETERDLGFEVIVRSTA